MEELKKTMLDVLNGLEGVINSKTVVGDAIKTKDATIIPLVEVSCGMGLGGFNKSTNDNKYAGGMQTRISPIAVLIVQNGYSKVINIKGQDAITKIVDILPDILNKITKKNNMTDDVKETVENLNVVYENVE